MKDGVEVVPTAPSSLYLYLLTCCSCIGGFLFGYDTGVISGALVSLGGSSTGFKLSTFESETVVSAAIIGAIVGAGSGSYGNVLLGRKPMILLSSILFTIGAVCMGLAANVSVLIVGRLIVGLAIGISSMTIPVYIAEASPSERRGTLVSANTLMITGGQFFASVFDGFLSTTPDGWRYMLGLVAIPSSIQFVCFLFLPESPRWLMDKGLEREARDVLSTIRGDANIDFEFALMQEESPHKGSSSPVLWSDFTAPDVWRALLLGCGLQVLQQLVGINTVMYYGATIIQMAGFSDPSTAIWLSAVVAFSNFAFTFVGMALVDRIGRRPLTLYSLLGVALSLLALGGAFFMAEHTSQSLEGVGVCQGIQTCFDCVANAACGYCGGPGTCVPGSPFSPAAGFSCAEYSFQTCPPSASTKWSGVIVGALFVYLACFASGMGCMPWTINAEIYPLHVRSVALGASTTANWVSNLLVSYTFLTVVSVLAPYGAFWLYAAIAVVGLVLLAKFLPETKGVPLEDIALLFRPATHAAYQPLH
ncbi:unnamed protein product [Aphanomyces euteiches]|uniref:Hexose transporter 1 n=1 Tax=Aphanomyces euteiches TaxID=100861 RepID=A0A6G0WX58_9STRA|nr:hypothetical protein Ae201684_010797 [Aphanomyces euteiches]KAH9061410.1 hypothetical protein Ae201684P_020746 [Aphanomyces euteiches]KAH9144258.1 hypothetical protein AeRB84_011787 [Aphanomyces euteiches]